MTPKERAAMQQALEALEGGLWDYGPGQDEHDKCNEVITALREALAGDNMSPTEQAEKVVRWLWVDPNERKLLMYYATEFEASHTKGLIKAEWSRMEFDK